MAFCVECSDQKAFQVADLVLLSRHAGKNTDNDDSIEILCLVEKVARTGGRREQCTIEVLVSAAIKGSGTSHAAHYRINFNTIKHSMLYSSFEGIQPAGGSSAPSRCVPVKHIWYLGSTGLLERDARCSCFCRAAGGWQSADAALQVGCQAGDVCNAPPAAVPGESVCNINSTPLHHNGGQRLIHTENHSQGPAPLLYREEIWANHVSSTQPCMSHAAQLLGLTKGPE